MISMDYNIPELFKSQVKEIKNFHFYRLINPNHPDLRNLGKRIHICSNTQHTCRLGLRTALLYDSLLVVAHGIMAMDFSYGLDSKDHVSCKEEQAWEFGSSLYNYMTSVQIKGLTGNIKLQS